MNRRAFVAALGSVLGAPLTTFAQQVGKIYRLGVIWAISESATAPYRAQLEGGLEELGWIPGRNVVLEHRFPDSQRDFRKLVASVLAIQVDAIAAMTNAVVVIFSASRRQTTG